MKSFAEEFKKFIMRGNVVDLAVAVVIGGAFGKIVTSFTNDIIMPIIGILTGGIDFSNLTLTLKSATDGKEALVLSYGLFINSVVNFLIIAFAIFIAIKAMSKLQRKEEEKEEEEPKMSKEEELLTEIRDVLKNK
jgi:large conductance mechanosensitive channel